MPGARRRSPARSIMYGTPIAITSSASAEAGFSCSPPTDANDRSAKMSSVGRAITISSTPASSRIANSSGTASARPPATSRSPRPLAIATRYTAIAIANAVSQTSGPPEARAVAPLHGAGAGTGCGRDPVRAGEANVATARSGPARARLCGRAGGSRHRPWTGSRCARGRCEPCRQPRRPRASPGCARAPPTCSFRAAAREW